MHHSGLARWECRPRWAKDRAAPINARVEKVARDPFFELYGPIARSTAIDNWFEWIYEGRTTKADVPHSTS